MQCPNCGMCYLPEVLEDLQEHKKYHDSIVNGVPSHRLKSDMVIYEEMHYRITVVIHASSPMSQRKRAQEAGMLAHRDTEFDFSPYHRNEQPDEKDVHVFLLFFRNRIIGFLIVEKRDTIWKYNWEQYESHEELEPIKNPPIWSVGLVWIHRRDRRKGFAQRLISEALSFLKINAQSISWHTPFTDLGKPLVRKICPDFFYIAK